MGFFFGKPKIEGDELRDCLTYYEAELKLKAFQTREARLYNKAVEKYGGPVPKDSHAAKEMCPAAGRLLQAIREILRRRPGMAPVTMPILASRKCKTSLLSRSW